MHHKHNALKRLAPLIIIIMIIFLISTFFKGEKDKTSPSKQTTDTQVIDEDTFTIISGSENKSLEPLLTSFGKENNIDIHVTYKGSIDIMMELENETIPYDAVWPANSLWIKLGDSKKRIKYEESIMTSPIVFGIKKSKAQELGFIGKEIHVKDILQAIQQNNLRFMMTSASQSNSGASAYFGFLYALAGNPEILTSEHLENEQLKTDITQLLSGIHRSSGSSGWLKDLFLKGNYDAMVNYEALIIEANQELVKNGKEPLYAVYPVDGIVLADSPFGYINKENKTKEDQFRTIKEYLLSDAVQEQIKKEGRRTGFGGVVENPDPTVFNSDWGIQADKVLSPITLPAPDVIRQAITLYQTEFKKPSYTVFCLDFSGSMYGEGEEQMKQAMRILLDQQEAQKYYLNTGNKDVTSVIAFSDTILKKWNITGNDPTTMQEMLTDIENFQIQGGTDVYTPAIEALRQLAVADNETFTTAVILMTDGKSNVGKKFDDLKREYERLDKDIPVFSILFGDASEEQLDAISEMTRARTFDGKEDLVKAFKEAKGYN